MPKPNHRARSPAAGGPIDADWKYFLDNVREDGRSYAVRVPAVGASPSYYLQYEKPRDGSRRPTDGGSSTSSRGGAGRKCRRMEEEECSSGEPALHDPDLNIEEDYRVFFQHVRPVGNGGFVLEHEGKVIMYDASDAVVSSDESSDESMMGAPEPNPLDRRVRRRKAKNVEEDQEDDVKNEVSVPTRVKDDTMADNVREDRDVEDGNKKKGKKVVAFRARGEDGGIMAEEDQKKKKKKKMVMKKEVAFPSNGKDGTMAAKNLKDKKKAGKKEVVVPAKGKDGPIVEVMVGSHGPMLVISESEVMCDNHACPMPGQVIKVEEEDEQLQIVPAVEKLRIISSLTNLSNGHETEPRITTGSHGVIWPMHINDREESEFKQRLIHVLNKPFSQGEYDKLFGMATIRNPLTRERRTRCGVKYYYSQHEKGKSYFDWYPDLAKQVEEASYPNRLSLLRGFFFWLENIGQDDQFRPWRGDHKRYKIMSL